MENFSYIPENYFSSTDEDEKEEKEEEEGEGESQKELLLKNVKNVINNIIKKDSNEEEKEEEFIPGITIDRYKSFCEYRTTFQNHYFHYLEKDFFDDTKKLLNNSFLFIDNRKAHLLNYDEIELQNISSNLDNSNYVESYKKVNNILEDLLINFASLKSLQQERIKPKFNDEEIENLKIDKEIKKLILNMMKKIKFCEALIKMEKIKNNISQKNENNIEEKIKKNVKMQLIGKIQNFSNEFRKNEQQFLKYLKEMGGGEEFLINNNNNINNNINNDSDESYNSLDDEKNIKKKDFLYTQEDDLESQIKKRDEDINILANSINQLAGICKDLQTVVHEQGTILDRIDYNIDVSYENSQRGLKFIKKAEEHQNSSCFRNVIILLFFIIFIESLLFIMKIF